MTEFLTVLLSSEDFKQRTRKNHERKSQTWKSKHTNTIHIKINIPYFHVKLGLPNQVMSNTIASNNPPNHICTKMNKQTNPPT